MADKLLDPEALGAVLETSRGRRINAQAKKTDRLAKTQADLDEAQAVLDRLYQGIEGGLLDLSEPTLAERVATARARRDRLRLRKAVDGARAPAFAGEKITPKKTAAFIQTLKKTLSHCSKAEKRARLAGVVDEIIVAEDRVTVTLDTRRLEACTLAPDTNSTEVPTFVPGWRRGRDRDRTFSGP